MIPPQIAPITVFLVDPRIKSARRQQRTNSTLDIHLKEVFQPHNFRILLALLLLDPLMLSYLCSLLVGSSFTFAVTRIIATSSMRDLPYPPPSFASEVLLRRQAGPLRPRSRLCGSLVFHYSPESASKSSARPRSAPMHTFLKRLPSCQRMRLPMSDSLNAVIPPTTSCSGPTHIPATPSYPYTL